MHLNSYTIIVYRKRLFQALHLQVAALIPAQYQAAKFRVVYGLLLVREELRIKYLTRMYIRLFNGDAISQPSMYAHSGAS